MNEHHELKTKLDHIATMLAKGEVWHKKSANECRKIGVRGVGRFHDAEGMHDAIELFEMTKILYDKMGYAPKVNYQHLEKADMYTIATHTDFKRHFMIWIDHEKEFIKLLLETLPHTMVDMELYEKVAKLTKSVQDEKFRVELVKNSFEFVGWNPHDISVKSKWLHDYFENEWKIGDEVDFNIG